MRKYRWLAFSWDFSICYFSKIEMMRGWASSLPCSTPVLVSSSAPLAGNKVKAGMANNDIQTFWVLNEPHFLSGKFINPIPRSPVHFIAEVDALWCVTPAGTPNMA